MHDFFAKVATAWSNAFDTFDFIDALEIILFVLVFYYVFKILKNANLIKRQLNSGVEPKLNMSTVKDSRLKQKDGMKKCA